MSLSPAFYQFIWGLALNNILSIDLESWIHFYSDALKEHAPTLSSAERKNADNDYIPDVTARILDLLDMYDQKATFFIIAEIYDWYPGTIDEIEKRGHEIGYHTHTHKVLYNKGILEAELQQSQHFINKFKPTGFRAPLIFITSDSMQCLKEYGFTYSSSTYDAYHITNYDGINEIPVSSFCYRGSCDNNNPFPRPLTIKMLSRQIPFGSGLFISLLGSTISYFIDSVNRKHVPAILFFHPWQLYMHEKIAGPGFKFKMLYRNPLCIPYTVSIENKLERLLKRHSFLSFRRYYGQ